MVPSKLVSSKSSYLELISHTLKKNERGVSLERYLIIIDEEKEYASALAAYLNGASDSFYRVAAVLSPPEAKDYVESGAVSIILASETYEKEVLCLAGSREIQVYWLSNEKQNQRKTVIYRYQSAKKIRDRLEDVAVKTEDIPVIAVFFPAGMFWTEQLCEGMAEEIAKTKRVLFLSFLPFCAERREENGMSELLYFARQGREELMQCLQKLKDCEGRLTRVGSVRWSMDLPKMTAEDVEMILQSARETGEFDLILTAIGYFDIAGLALMHACELLFVPVWETEKGQGFQAEFIRQLREGGENRLLHAVRELPVQNLEDAAGMSFTAAEAAEQTREYLEQKQNKEGRE